MTPKFCPWCNGGSAEVFDCPFCGKHFNVLDFHRDEILDEARELIKNAQTALAMEKFEYLLSVEPDDFDTFAVLAGILRDCFRLFEHSAPDKEELAELSGKFTEVQRELAAMDNGLFGN